MENEKKITLDEYIDKYNSKTGKVKNVKLLLTLIYCLIGLAIAAILFFVVLRLFDLSEIAGYIGIGVAVLIFVLFYIVPVCKISATKAFQVDAKNNSVGAMKRANKALRKEISEKMIDLYKYADTGYWYSNESINALIEAQGKDKELKSALSNILKKDVKKACDRIITEHALTVFAATAVSQSEKLDTLFVIVSEINLIKKIITLYGYRPSDEKLLKIYKTVIINALLSYGAQTLTTSLANGIGKKIAESAGSISFFGDAIKTILGSTMDGLANLTFTVKVGTQTKKYLLEEYHLQDLLDEMDIKEDIIEEENALIKEAKAATSSMKKTSKKGE